jgi:hypothetical protein
VFTTSNVPPIVHINLLELFNIGLPASIQVVHPGVQGLANKGMHGAATNIGVPTAATVAALLAAITVGFVWDWQELLGGKTTLPVVSIILAAGTPPTLTLFTGGTKNWAVSPTG